MEPRPALNDRQLEVLRWIGEGCPDREWPDYTHRISARSLTTRGLVTIRGHGPSWTAAITDAGRTYLEHGPSRPEQEGRPASPPEVDPATGRVITAQTVLEALLAGNGRLQVHDPSPRVRAAYVRAISRVRAQRLSPPGHRITYAGRHHGDLVIRLIDESQPSGPSGQVPTPSHLDEDHPVVRALRERADLDIADDSRERVLLVHLALALEAERRGYVCAVPSDGASLVITIDGVEAPFLVKEEKERVRAVPEDARGQVKYEWQRVPLHPIDQWTGRLVLTLQISMWSPPWWADRKRWTLDSRLAQALEAAEDWCAGERRRLDEAEQARQERQQRWEAAVPRARRAHADAVNARRADAQLAALSRAADLRSYADAIDARAQLVPDEQRDATHRWAAWLRQEADRVDPLMHACELQYREPEKPSASDLDGFMPPGMTVAKPPA